MAASCLSAESAAYAQIAAARSTTADDSSANTFRGCATRAEPGQLAMANGARTL
jgi:hypothetical protein